MKRLATVDFQMSIRQLKTQLHPSLSFLKQVIHLIEDYMSKKNKMLGMYGIALAMMTDPLGKANHFDLPLDYPDKLVFPPETNPNKQALNKPCPNGCKTYFFNEQGDFETGRMKRDECVFVCHASNDKNAIRKFKKLYDPTLNVTPS